MAKLPILMYHHVISGEGEGLTISVKNLEEQFKYLSENEFQSHHLADLMDLTDLPKGKNIVITFDDCYLSHKEIALPLLQKYNLKATFFAPLKFLGNKDGWNTGELPMLSVAQLKALDRETIELGFHSFQHLAYSELSAAQVEADTRRCIEFIEEHDLKFSPVLAYPYGKFPRKDPENKTFNKILAQNGIQYGLRVGNRINDFPFKNPYQIQRIDIKGEWSLSKFKRKIKFGKYL
ncbi:polysaccharide deacetylase family protein [Aequorivita marina]|uniref:polysaccharide deacetylase family protein n=1 Tax=Aequorivita marina TaxID=3073654 RepID=UPI0028771EAD|nr:polysaccharide deacetylase family protein [Aequorivita sp. S2608]MDS1298089.1 polysaccharide deacetylase family protein [Aequorivita sp. S2608]